MLRHMFEWDVIKLDSFFRKLLVLWQAFDISFFRSSRLVKALLLSSAGKLLVIPVVIWGETHIYTTLLLTRLFMAVASTQAITGRCVYLCRRQSHRERGGGHMNPITPPYWMAGKRKRRKKGREVKLWGDKMIAALSTPSSHLTALFFLILSISKIVAPWH